MYGGGIIEHQQEGFPLPWLHPKALEKFFWHRLFSFPRDSLLRGVPSLFPEAKAL